MILKYVWEKKEKIGVVRVLRYAEIVCSGVRWYDAPRAGVLKVRTTVQNPDRQRVPSGPLRTASQC